MSVFRFRPVLESMDERIVPNAASNTVPPPGWPAGIETPAEMTNEELYEGVRTLEDILLTLMQ